MAPRCTPSGISKRVALVAGATGLVGGHVVDRLAESADVDRVVVLVRKKTGKWPSPKVEERIVDYDALDRAAFEEVDDVYACLGTTIKKAGSQDAFRKVDHDYTLAVANIAKAAGAKRFAVVSSVGASARSSNFYLRVKGETDDAIENVGFPTLVIARPSVLVGNRDESRPGEKVGIAVSKAFSFAMVGGLKKFRPIEARRVAHAMVAAMNGAEGTRVLENEALLELAPRAS
jgi:uncharacterized protein YbjT (DUF2867 family)